MKKLYILTLLLFTFGFQQGFAQTVTLGSVPTNICANEKLYIPVTLTGSFSASNILTIQISDNLGVFGGGTTNVGAIVTNANGEQFVEIHVDPSITLSTGYLLRASASSPAVNTLGVPVTIDCTTRDYFWVGGGGNWSDYGNHWATTSGGSTFHTEPPNFKDDVFFDNNSFSSESEVVIDNESYCNNMNWTNNTDSHSLSGYYYLNVNGNFLLADGVARPPYIRFNATQKQNVQIKLGQETGPSGTILFGNAGSYSLQSNLNCYDLNLVNSSQLNTNDFNLSAYYNMYSDGTASLNTGSSDVRVGGINALGMSISGNSHWYFNGNGSSLSSDLVLNQVTIENGNYYIYGDTQFNELELFPGTTIRIQPTFSLRIYNALNAVGQRDQLISIISFTSGSPADLIVTGAILNTDYILVQDNILTNGGLYNPTNTVDKGGNSGDWDFTNSAIAPLGFYWVGGSGDWSEYDTHWATGPGGSVFHTTGPSIVDGVVFDANSFPSGGTLTINQEVEINDMIWENGSGANQPIIRSYYPFRINGQLRIDDGVQRKLEYMIFQGEGGIVQNLDFGDNTGVDYSNIEFQNGGTKNLQSDLKADYLNFYGGLFNTLNKDLEINSIYIANDLVSTFWGSSTINISYQISSGTSTPDFNPESSTFVFDNDYQTYIYGPLTFNNVIAKNNIFINGDNIFDALTFEPGITAYLQNGSNQSIASSFSATGIRSDPITIKSNSTGSIATITSLATGTYNTEYLVLQDNTVTGATFNTDNSIITGDPLNVNGWTFGATLSPIDFYWVGNGGDWSDFANHWAKLPDGSTGAHPFAPGQLDHVFFTSNSFTSADQTVTLDKNIELASMIWDSNSGTNSPTISKGSNNHNLTISGALEFDNGVNQDISSIILNSTTLNNSLDFADNLGDVTNRNITLKGGGSWDLQSQVVANGFNLESATVDTKNNEIDVYNLSIGNTSFLIAGLSDVYFNYLYDNGTINSGSSTFYGSDNVTLYVYGVTSTLNNLIFENDTKVYVGTSLTVNNLTLSPGVDFRIGYNYTISLNNLNAVGLSSSPIRIRGSYVGAPSFISKPSGTVDGEYLFISDNEASGGATFNANNSINQGNVLGWNFSAPFAKPYYWVGGNGSWSEATTHWVDADGGTSFYTNPPGFADNVFFTESSFDSNNQTVTIDNKSYVHDLTFSTSKEPILANSSEESFTVFGSFVLSTGVNQAINDITFQGTTSGITNTIDFADNTSGYESNFLFQGDGIWSLSSDLIAKRININGGQINANANTITTDELYMRDNIQLDFNAGSSTINTSRFSIQAYNGQLTFNEGTSTINIGNPGSTYNFLESYPDGSIFNNVNFKHDSYVSGNNSFSEFNVQAGITVRLGNGTTQTVNSLNLTGTETALISLESDYQGFAGTFSVPVTGSVLADYVIIRDNYAVGGGDFTAANSSSVSNVQGWSGLKTGQIITFPPLNDLIFESDRTLAATTTSGLPTSYSVIPITGDGSISADLFSTTMNGLVGIQATQNGDGVYGPAKPVVQYVYSGLGDEVNTLGQMKEASYAIGVPDGVTQGNYQLTDLSVTYPYDVVVAPDGKVVIASEQRVLIWNQLPDAFDVPADVVVGQSSFNTLDYTYNASTIISYEPRVAIGPSGQLIVTDNERGVLIWNTIPSVNGTPADVIIGQNDFTSVTYGTDADKISYTYSVAVSPDGKLVVSDHYANRLLVFNTIPTTNGASADVVIGQPDFSSSDYGTSDRNFNGPGDIAISTNGELIVPDIYNHRVLIFNTIPTTNYQAADRVIGQPNFSSNNNGTSGNELNYPRSVASSRTGKLAISDGNNHRVLIYDQIPQDNTTEPNIVLGQPDLFTGGFDYSNISLRTFGAQGICWDNSENFLMVDQNNRRVLVYGAKDLEVPSITLNSGVPSSHVLGQSTTLEFALEDRSGIGSANILYQEVTKQNPTEIDTWESAPLVDQGNGTYSFDLASIEGLTSNPIGFDLWLAVFDNVNNYNDTYLTKARVPITYPNGFTLNTFGTGANTSDYRMFTVPLNLANANVVSVFDGILGGSYNAGLLRVFQYPGGSSTSYNEYNEGGFTNLNLGNGYFGLSASTGSENTGSGTTSFMSEVIEITPGEESTLHYVPITLVNGWNLIGNPLLSTLDWNYATQINGLTTAEVTEPQEFNGSGYQITNEIGAGKGAFVMNNTGGNITFRVPTYNLVNGRVASRELNVNPLSSNSWEVRFNARSNSDKEFILGGVGMEEGALESYDGNDWLNPPTFAEMKLIEFKKPKDFPLSIKKDIRPYTESEKWEFEYRIATQELEQHTLVWDNSYFGEDAPAIFLIDKTHLKVIDMREASTYTFDHKGISKFEIHFGEMALEALLPDQTLVDSPYPNPFITDVNINIGLPASQEDYKVSITIYNSVGRLVKNLANISLSAGYHNFNWDGNNDQGVRMAAGMYAYKVNISGESSSQISGQLIKR